MPRKNTEERRERLRERNEKVIKRFKEVSRKHPQWKFNELVKEVGKDHVELSLKTIEQIIRGDYEKYIWKEPGAKE